MITDTVTVTMQWNDGVQSSWVFDYTQTVILSSKFDNKNYTVLATVIRYLAYNLVIFRKKKTHSFCTGHLEAHPQGGGPLSRRTDGGSGQTVGAGSSWRGAERSPWRADIMDSGKFRPRCFFDLTIGGQQGIHLGHIQSRGRRVGRKARSREESIHLMHIQTFFYSSDDIEFKVWSGRGVPWRI